MLYDEAKYYENIENEWKFRLPWPLFDVTSVKIPIEWLPQKCLLGYLRKRKIAEQSTEKVTQPTAEDSIVSGAQPSNKTSA